MAWDDKNYFWTCKECKMLRSIDHHSVGYCSLYHGDVSKDGQFCANFETPDGKRPRFCRLAGSVDEMAEALVFFENYWFFTESTEPYDTIEDAVAAAKAWLMEVEK